MSRVYTREDSEEVRRAYIEARKKNGHAVSNRVVVTKDVWAALEKRGADMSRYVEYDELRKEFPFLPKIRQRPKVKT